MMQPHILVTEVGDDVPTKTKNNNNNNNSSHVKGGAGGNNNTHTKGGLGVGGFGENLNVPTWEAGRRPSFLPNDTQMILMPKVRRLSTYDLSINDTVNTDTFESKSGGDTEVDLEDAEPPPCLSSVTQWVSGDVQYITDFLDRWPLISFALPLKLANIMLRTMGAPVLANNPFSGVLIIAALVLEEPWVIVWAVCALCVCLLMAVILRQPQHIVVSGQVTQHGLLLGLLVGHYFVTHPHTSLVHSAVTLTLNSALSVLVGNAISTWLSQTNLPGLTLAYSLLGSVLCAGFGYHDFVSTAPPVSPFHNATITQEIISQEIQWAMAVQGMVRGGGQVYGCSSLTSSLLVFAAMFLFSPIVFGQAVVGAITGTLCGVLMDEAPYTSLYSGLYGRHSLLTSLSLGGFFFVINFYSSLAGICGAVLSSFIYHAIAKNALPVLTTPHVLTTLVLLHARLRGGMLKRVDLIYLTFPEMHRRLFRPGNAVEDCAIS